VDGLDEHALAGVVEIGGLGDKAMADYAEAAQGLLSRPT
jgi:hypothetical protein